MASYDDDYHQQASGFAYKGDDEKAESPKQVEEQRGASQLIHNDPFGDEEVGEVKYRTMSWWQCGIVMIAETIALGILSLPAVVASIGLAPAVILIVGLGILATYTGYNLGQFKMAYPHVHSMGDAGYILGGRIGQEVFGFAQLCFLIFIMGSHIVTFAIMMNTLTEHGACSIVFNVVGLIVSFLFTLPRTLKNVSWLSVASFISVFAALMITMIAIGIQHPGKSVKATVDNSFYRGFLSMTNIVFAYAGHVAFFGFISEMKKPKEFYKALFLLQGLDTSLYVIAAVVIYRYGGQDVESPALGSTSELVSKIAYGVAIPTIVIAGIINGHVAAKYIYIRMFRGSDRLHQRSLFSIGSWTLIVLVLWVIAWIIAEAIPVFSTLLGLIVALFASWFTYGLSGVFWLHLNKGRWFSSFRMSLLSVLNIVIVGIGATLCGVGLYVSGRNISENPANQPFKCSA